MYHGLDTAEHPLVFLFRSSYSAPEQQRSCLSRFRSASPSRPRVGGSCHEAFYMEHVTTPFPHARWGITSPPLSCTCFGDCVGQDLSHAGYKLCQAPDIYCLPGSVPFYPTLNFTLISLHMRESWQWLDSCPFSRLLVVPYPRVGVSDTGHPEIARLDGWGARCFADTRSVAKAMLRFRLAENPLRSRPSSPS